MDDGIFFGFEIADLRQLYDDAFLGYLRMDVVHPPDGAIWGKFNNRSVNLTWVNDLAASFADLLDNCTNLHAMQVTIDPRWLVNPNLKHISVNGLKVDKVPLMEFNEEGEAAIKNDNLWVLSGNHRCLALARYIDKMRSDQEKMKLAIKEELKARKDQVVADVDPEKEKDLKEVQDMVKSLQAKIDSSSMWAVAVYDRGASCESPYPQAMADPTNVQPRSRARPRTNQGRPRPCSGSYPETRQRAFVARQTRSCSRRSLTNSRTLSSRNSPG
jgi:hypothetical protein